MRLRWLRRSLKRSIQLWWKSSTWKNPPLWLKMKGGRFLILRCYLRSPEVWNYVYLSFCTCVLYSISSILVDMPSTTGCATRSKTKWKAPVLCFSFALTMPPTGGLLHTPSAAPRCGKVTSTDLLARKLTRTGKFGPAKGLETCCKHFQSIAGIFFFSQRSNMINDPMEHSWYFSEMSNPRITTSVFPQGMFWRAWARLFRAKRPKWDRCSKICPCEICSCGGPAFGVGMEMSHLKSWLLFPSLGSCHMGFPMCATIPWCDFQCYEKNATNKHHWMIWTEFSIASTLQPFEVLLDRHTL